MSAGVLYEIKMVTIKKIKLNNFLSHKETELIFNENEKLIIDGKSGSGKSSIVDAIIWALYGVARTDNRNLVKYGSKLATVVLVLQDEEKTYKIERKTTDKAKNTLDIFIADADGKFRPAPVTGIREGQEWIETNITRASYHLFINSVAYPQDNINSFVRQTATKRKDLLLEIVGVKDFDTYYSSARDILTTRNEDRIRLSSTIENTKLFINEKEASCVDEEDLKNKIKEAEATKSDLRNKLEKINATIIETENHKKELLSLLARKEESKKEEFDLSSQRTKNEILIKEYESIDINKIQEDLSALLKKEEEKNSISEKMEKDYARVMKLNSLMANKPVERDYTKEISELNKRLIPLLTQTDSCPAGDKCPFITPILEQIAYYEEQIKEKDVESHKMREALSIYQKELSLLCVSEVTEEERAKYRDLVKDVKNIDEYKKKATLAEEKKKRLPELLETLIAIDNKINSIRATIIETEKKISDAQSRTVDHDQVEKQKKITEKLIMDLDFNIAKWNADICMSQKTREEIVKYSALVSESESKIKILNSDIENLSLIKEAFSSKGLKAVAVDYLIPRLEEKINEILSRLSDFRVRLDTQKDLSSSEGVTEGLFINIINDMGEELDFANYSGGERLKITVAIAEALASLQKIGFRILDELFIGLDEESTEHFADVVNKLNERFKQMICISHLRNIKDIFDKKVEIKKVNGVSIINK